MNRQQFIAGLGMEMLSASSASSASYSSSYILPTNGLIIHNKPSGFVQSGGEVTDWINDVTGLGTGQSNGAIPLLYTASDSELNGLPSVRMKNHSAFLPYKYTGSTVQGLTIFSVHRCQVPTSSDGSMPIWFSSDSGPMDIWTFDSNQSRRGFNTFQSENNGITVPTNELSLKEILTVVVTIDATVNPYQIYRNGNLNYETSGYGTRALNNFQITSGFVDNAPLYTFNGWKSEYIVYNKVLTTSEISAIHQHLKTKYNII